MEKVVGLDLGVGSLGWTVIESESLDNFSIIDDGCRIFQEHVDKKGRDGGTSKNETRRIARGARRRHQRLNRRKKKLLNILKANGMAPQIEDLQSWYDIDPYEMRVKALDIELSPKKFGRALYHLSQRRGFKSNRKSGDTDNEESVVYESIKHLEKEREARGLRTLGELLYDKKDDRSPIRGDFTSRQQYKDEFEQIWHKQASFNADLYDDDLKNEIFLSIFFQRPVGSQSDKIGKCVLEPQKQRARKAYPTYQEFRILKNVNALTLTDLDGTEINIEPSMRKLWIDHLMKKKQLPFSKMKSMIGVNSNAEFNLQRGGNKSLTGHVTNSIMTHANMFGKKWFELGEEEKLNIINLIIHTEKPEVLERLAREKWGFDDEQIDHLKNKVQLEKKTDTFARYSRRAIRKLLPYLREGDQESTAIKKAGYTLFEPDNSNLKTLPSPEHVRNPTVQLAMNEVRKVINAIIRKHGMPHTIRVEMTRDLKSGLEKRKEIQKRQDRNRKINEKAKKELAEQHNISDPSYTDILKYKLWQECKETSPFSGKTISSTELFSPAVQIEHIFPFSRSLDDSYMNKTLAFADENITKGNRTPYEWLNDTNEFDEMLQRVKNSSMPWPKRKRFSQKEVKLDDFIQRQLNDTRYISKMARQYLDQLGCKVTIATGQTTAMLRRQWGLNSVVGDSDEKERSDHRHHTVDAIVVALTSTAMLQKLSRAHSRNAHGKVGVPDPKDHFRDEVKSLLKDIVISYKPQHKLSGALHEDTNYGPGKWKNSKKKRKMKMTVRKYVHLLSKRDVSNIKDDYIREEIIEKEIQRRQDELGSRDKAIESFEKNPPQLPDKNGSRPIKRVRLEFENERTNYLGFDDKDGGTYRLATKGNNHHVEIFEKEDDKGELKQNGEVISMVEAYRRIYDNEELYMREHPEYGTLKMVLHKNDLFTFPDGNVYRMQNVQTSGQMTFVEQYQSESNPSKQYIVRKLPTTLEAQKIEADPLGDITIPPF